MAERDRTWVVVASYRYGYEADIAVARLRAARVPAVKRGDGPVGLLSPGYDKHVSGVQVLVPSDVEAEARRVLRPDEEPSNDHPS